ncbi:hypothetical protein [Streptomyces katsurahamanus]|uniref:XRE family transcriptional regulator n=1 Tax=Streptomyces katsurahamanus TaxID=2577098 RepID=A0ABW9NX06_9ACTN|nr:hypothetical protein [Streptomyces katsurahamanus]MQS37822.1 hypothetical protein [Streptomyces katsurahamanus]
MALASELRDLRDRAGRPSYREIERLIARQGRDHAMGRSTIQEKLSGKSSASLVQVLSLVEALAEHARRVEIPLTPLEVDKSVWRERYMKSIKTGKPDAPATVTTESSIDSTPWNIEPLRQAQMYDLIEVIESSRTLPVASWLPQVIKGILLAGMSCFDFLKRAARENPQQVLQIVVALHYTFPPEERDRWDPPPRPWDVTDHNRTVGVYLAQAARVHGAIASPAIVAGMHRAGLGTLIETYLNGVAKVHPAPNIARAVAHLRFTTLPNEADQLLEYVGTGRQFEEVIRIAQYFTDHEQPTDRTKILKGAGKDWHRFKNIARLIQENEIEDVFLKELIWGIPYGEHLEFAEKMGDGNEELAERIRRAADEPPF